MTFIAHLDGLAGQLEEASRDGHHPGVLRVKRSQVCHGETAKVLLVVDEALRKEGHVARDKVVDDGTLTAVLLHERYPELVALDRVQHLHNNDGLHSAANVRYDVSHVSTA